MDISEPESPRGAAWLRLGFRPFFLAAGSYAVVGMLFWFAAYSLNWTLPFAGISAMTWHAHEMIFGYSLAVIAGFLLAAVGNWTGLQTVRGTPLLLLFLAWLLARLLLLGETAWLIYAAAFDLLFMASLALAITAPILRARQWGNLGIVAIVLLLLGSNLLFYLGAGGWLEQGVYLGLYSGLYLILGLVLVMSRRVVPFFIERGVGYPVELRNSRIIDVTSLLVFLVFWLADLYQPNGVVVAWSAVVLVLLHGIRLQGWYTSGIWRKPLLWSLYLAHLAIILGFGLKALVYYVDLSPYLALHAYAVGGIGLITLGMMARVILGHTGRAVSDPPGAVFWLFAVLIVAMLVRVALPILHIERYALWIGLSQWLWIIAFSGFLLVYAPMLVHSRVDGKDG
ncbi:MAG: NnrS family protein [Thiogranum sp.]|nr:NnrS family protein [Thiogranum sp.]